MLKLWILNSGIVAHACNPAVGKAEAAGSHVLGQPGLCRDNLTPKQRQTKHSYLFPKEVREVCL